MDEALRKAEALRAVASVERANAGSLPPPHQQPVDNGLRIVGVV
jgi:hypothetical protein